MCICNPAKSTPKNEKRAVNDSPLFKSGRSTRIRTLDPLLPKQVRYRAAPHSEKAMIQEHAIKVNFHVSTYTNNLRLPWHASVQYSKHITISCTFRSGANFISDALSHFFRSLCALRLYHHANQGFSAGGSNQRPPLQYQIPKETLQLRKGRVVALFCFFLL